MLNRLNNVWGKTLACLVGCAAAIALIATPATDVMAAPKRVVRSASPDESAKLAELAAGQHQSIIRVEDTGTAIRRPLKVGLGKSVLLEFSRELRDVMVSNPEAVDVVMLSSNRVFLLAKKLAESNAFFFDSNGEQFAAFEISVSRDTSALQSLLQRLIPSSRITVEMMNETVILTGSVKTPADSTMATQIAKNFANVDVKSTDTQSNATGVVVKSTVHEPNERVINMLAVEGEEQVMLRVQVAEVQRSVVKQLGVNLGSTLSIGNISAAALTQNALPLSSAAGLGKIPNVGVDTTAASMAAACKVVGTAMKDNIIGYSGVSGAWHSGNNCIPFVLQALERQGLVKTLAEPNLTAVSGEPAKFLAGGEYPVPYVDTTGAISVVYKEFGVSVAFTPLVMSEGRISLKIEAEVSELTSDGAVTLSNIQLPALKKRSSKSTVELPSGASIAMAGLISEDTRQNIDGLPGIKDLPILGTLFRSRDFQKSETELVIIVTPYMVKPVNPKALARPSDGLVDPTDLKANFLGHLNRIYGRGSAQPTSDLKGDYGFIVE